MSNSCSLENKINIEQRLSRNYQILFDLPGGGGARCFIGGKRRPVGGQLKTLRKSYLGLLRKPQFDTNDISDSALCSSHGTIRNILELICNEPVEYHLRLKTRLWS